MLVPSTAAGGGGCAAAADKIPDDRTSAWIEPTPACAARRWPFGLRGGGGGGGCDGGDGSDGVGAEGAGRGPIADGGVWVTVGSMADLRPLARQMGAAPTGAATGPAMPPRQTACPPSDTQVQAPTRGVPHKAGAAEGRMAGRIEDGMAGEMEGAAAGVEAKRGVPLGARVLLVPRAKTGGEAAQFQVEFATV